MPVAQISEEAKRVELLRKEGRCLLCEKKLEAPTLAVTPAERYVVADGLCRSCWESIASDW
jgi:hypothetical protein